MVTTFYQVLYHLKLLSNILWFGGDIHGKAWPCAMTLLSVSVCLLCVGTATDLCVVLPLLAAYKHADGKKIDGRRVLVDVERGRTIKGWRPRRLGKILLHINNTNNIWNKLSYHRVGINYIPMGTVFISANRSTKILTISSCFTAL